MTTQDYEITSFFILAAMFELLERWRPAREIDRWRDLKIDVFAFALAVALNCVSHYSITRLAEDEAPVWLRRGLHSLQGLPAGGRTFLAIAGIDFTIYWLHRAIAGCAGTRRTTCAVPTATAGRATIGSASRKAGSHWAC